MIDVNNFFKTLYEVELPLSPESLLQWVGFSDEGQLFTCDSDGVMWMLINGYGNSWVPCLEIEKKYKINSEKFYPVSVSGDEVLGVILRTGNDFATQTDKNRVQTFKMTIPFLNLITEQITE